MVVKDLMNRDVVSVLPTATLSDVGRKMKEHKIGTVLVIDQDQGLKGIITDRDIAVAAAADHKDPRVTFATEIMTAEPLCINADADFDAALRIMNQAKVRRLPVKENGKIVGILSSADLAGSIKNEFEQFIGLEEAYAKH